MNGLELAGGTAIIAALITILIGIAYCFFGYRIFRILLGVLGFLAGAATGLVIVQLLITGGTLSQSGALLYYILGALVCGAIGAVLLIFLYFIGIYLLGATVGFILGSLIALAIDVDQTVLLIIAGVLAFLCGILALILQRILIIIATAISGAGNIVLGLAVLVLPGQALQRLTASPDLSTGVTWLLDRHIWLGILWVILAIAGMLVQFLWTGKKKPQPAPAAAGAPPQVVVQQYNVPGQAAPQYPSAPPPVVQRPPMAAPPPVVPSPVQPAPQAPPLAAPGDKDIPPLPTPSAGHKFCPQCGQPVAYGTTFCTNCGNSVAHLWK